MACRRAGGLARRSYTSFATRTRHEVAAIERQVGSEPNSRHLCVKSAQRGFRSPSDLYGITHMTVSWWSRPTLLDLGSAPCRILSGGSLQFSRGYASDLPPHQEIGMPSLSPTMTQGNIAGWKKKEGDQVAAGDVLCEIETDKATLEMESMEEGYVAKIVVGDGGKDIKVGQTICIMVESKDDISAFSNFQPAAGGGGEDSAPKQEAPPPPPPKQESAPEPPPPKSSPPPPPKPAASMSSSPPPSSGDRIFASPAAKKLAAEENLPLSSIKGTGPDGHILKADVEDYLASGGAKQEAQQEAQVSTGDSGPAPGGGLDPSDIEKAKARRLVQSKQTIPHYYLSLDTRVDKILALLEQLNASQGSDEQKKLSVNDFVIKAAALALRKVPECNSSWTDDFIRQYHNVHISVPIEAQRDLLVPVVKDADKKGLLTIAQEIKGLTEKAKSNNLEPSDYEGGTFTVTNFGENGIKQFSSIINPPQSCILAVGTAEKRVIPGVEKGEFVVGTYMTVTMSCDHRVVDGALGALWLGAFKGYIEDPITLLL